MGEAMLNGWISKNIIQPEQIKVIDPSPSESIQSSINVLKNPADIQVNDQIQHIIIFAIKPQMAPKVVPLYKDFIGQNTIFCSVMAGISCQTIFSLLSPNISFIRIMPNTPALIGKGVSIGFASPKVTEAEKESCQTLFKATGIFEWIDEELKLDAVTAISGSGPAYFFHFTECLAKAGEELGLSKDLSLNLAINTFIGSATLKESSPLPLSTLRENITSPGGTTEAALQQFMDENLLEKVVLKAVQAAQKRSQELS